MKDKKREQGKKHEGPNWREERLDEESHLHEKDEAWIRRFIGDSGMEKFGSAILEERDRQRKLGFLRDQE